MKKLLFLLISSLATFPLYAQNSSNPFKKIYIDGGAGPASHNGAYAQLGLKGVLKNNWTASISYYAVDMDPKNLPADYEPGVTLLLIFPVPDAMPSVNMKLINFTGGRYFELGRKTWFTADAGISIVTAKKLEFTRKPATTNDWFYFPSNYSTEETSQFTIGGIIRTDFTWAFARYFGMGVGAFANVNSIQSPVGFEFKLMAGALRGKKMSRK